MSSTDEHHLVRSELERVLSSDSFARSDRHSKLLRFLVERHLEGRDDELKESLIGVQVFGRSADYDPKSDSTVRTEAVRLRARLNQYYAGEGDADPLVIELPKGGYIPRWHVPAAGRLPATRPKRLWLALGGIAVILSVVAAILYRTITAPISVAVLPLTNDSGSAASDSFVDGLTDEIIRQVSGIPGLAVRSRTSSFAVKSRAQTAREAARQLDAEFVVEGSVSQSASQLRITTRLVRIRDDAAIWTGTFDRRMRDSLALQQEISRGVVNALQLKLARGSRRYDTDAYDLYLRARAAGDVRFAGDDEIIGLFEEAINKDASIAPAYAGLAVAHAFRSFESARNPQHRNELDKMRASAERAIALDPQLADAHSARGAAYAQLGQWDLAEQSFRRAIELDPARSATRYWFARFVLWPLGRMKEAEREARTAAAIDPLSPLAKRELADVLLSSGEYDEAARYCEALPADVLSASECVGRARLAQGRPDDAIQIMGESATNNWGYLAYAHAQAGRLKEAERLATAAPVRYPNRRGAFQYALAFAGLKDTDKTLEQLRKMADVGPVRIGFTLNSPEFAFLAGDPRTKALRKEVGLPD